MEGAEATMMYGIFSLKLKYLHMSFIVPEPAAMINLSFTPLPASIDVIVTRVTKQSSICEPQCPRFQPFVISILIQLFPPTGSNESG